MFIAHGTFLTELHATSCIYDTNSFNQARLENYEMGFRRNNIPKMKSCTRSQTGRGLEVCSGGRVGSWIIAGAHCHTRFCLESSFSSMGIIAFIRNSLNNISTIAAYSFSFAIQLRFDWWDFQGKGQRQRRFKIFKGDKLFSFNYDTMDDGALPPWTRHQRPHPAPFSNSSSAFSFSSDVVPSVAAEEEDICRVCRESTPDIPLLHPWYCPSPPFPARLINSSKCSGSIKYVHQDW